jgi:hypothetical protein
MDSTAIRLDAVVVKAQKDPQNSADVSELLPYFREQGLDLKGFYPVALEVSVAPKAVLLKKPLSVFRNVRWRSGRVGDVSFFPCKMTVEGMPFFGFVLIDHSATPDSTKLFILAPTLAMLQATSRLQVEFDGQRAGIG